MKIGGFSFVATFMIDNFYPFIGLIFVWLTIDFCPSLLCFGQPFHIWKSLSPLRFFSCYFIFVIDYEQGDEWANFERVWDVTQIICKKFAKLFTHDKVLHYFLLSTECFMIWWWLNILRYSKTVQHKKLECQ